MDSEQLMLNLFKKQQFRLTHSKLQKAFMLITAASSVLGLLLTLIFYTNWWYVYVFVGVLAVVCINTLLVWGKFLKLSTASLITVLYNAFVFTPGLWLITGLHGAAPLVSLIILVSIMILLSGNKLKWVLAGFFLVMLGLTVYTALMEFPRTDETMLLIYLIAAYWTTAAVVVLYMLSKQNEFNELNNKFLRSSFKDELTQLYNRKLLDLIIEYQETLYQKDQTDYIFVMFDVDDFKKLNDERGHVYGDIVLRTIAKCIHDKARSSDFVVRYGGDEFLVIQSNASDTSIKLFIERIETEMKTACMLDVHVEASYGFAARSECDTPEAALKLADERLYENKQAKKSLPVTGLSG